MTKKGLEGRVTRAQALGLLLLAVTYAPGVFKESFWSDDYPALMDTPGVVDHLLRDARPTSAGLLSISFSHLRSPQDAWVLRLLALLGLFFLYLVIARSISSLKNSWAANFSIAIALCIPTFQMYVHWSIAWFYPWATLWGVLAFRFWRSNELLKKFFGVLFLTLALTTYPPAALFFMAMIAVVGVFNNSKSREILVEIIHGFILLAISAVTSALAIFLTMHFSNTSASQRVSFITLSDIPQKIIWLVSRPLVVGLRPFLVDSPAPLWALFTAFPLLLVLFIGLKRQANRMGESIWLRGTAASLPMLLSLIPLAITADNQIEFRILPGYCWGMLSMGIFLLLNEVESSLESTKLREGGKKYVLLTFPVILVVVAVFTINLHYWQLFGGPYEKKTKFLNEKISACASTADFNAVLIVAPKDPFLSLPRLGVFSTSTDLASEWVPKPNVQILLERRHLSASVTYLTIRPLPISFRNDTCPIDLEEYKKLLK